MGEPPSSQELAGGAQGLVERPRRIEVERVLVQLGLEPVDLQTEVSARPTPGRPRHDLGPLAVDHRGPLIPTVRPRQDAVASPPASTPHLGGRVDARYEADDGHGRRPGPRRHRTAREIEQDEIGVPTRRQSHLDGRPGRTRQGCRGRIPDRLRRPGMCRTPDPSARFRDMGRRPARRDSDDPSAPPAFHARSRPDPPTMRHRPDRAGKPIRRDPDTEESAKQGE